MVLKLESENITSSTSPASPKRPIKLIAVIAVTVISLVTGALLVSAFISSPQGEKGWLFKGAYATYDGSTTLESEDLGMISMSISVEFTIRLEIVDFNSTHALLSTSFKMSSSLGEMEVETVEDQNSTWVPLSQIGFINAFEDRDLSNSYETTVNIAGFGSRTCTVYEYEISDEGLTMAVYVDKSIGWPLKMTLSMTSEESINLSLDINLSDTNIPALK